MTRKFLEVLASLFTATKKSAEEVVKHRDEHYINGKWVDCKSAILRQEMQPPAEEDFGQQKNVKKKKSQNSKDQNTYKKSKHSSDGTRKQPSNGYSYSGSGYTDEYRDGVPFMDHKHYSTQNYDQSMNYYDYGQYNGFANRSDSQYYQKPRYDRYDTHQKYTQHKTYQGKRDVNPEEYQQHTYQIHKDSTAHSTTYHYGRTSNSKMETGSVPSNYIQSTMVQMPFSLNEENSGDHHQSSSLFRSASPAKLSPMIPSSALDELSPQRRTAAGLLHKSMIPVPEEEENLSHHPNHQYGLEETIRLPVGLQQKQAGPPKILPVGDTSTNYTPFGGGTYFGPTVLNRYGDNSDFFTPQAKQLRPRNIAAVPGDASAKNYNRQGKKPAKNSDSGFSAGFSGLASSVIKVQNQEEQKE